MTRAQGISQFQIDLKRIVEDAKFVFEQNLNNIIKKAKQERKDVD